MSESSARFSAKYQLVCLPRPRMKSVIVGTAGHIDHGKTALVKALTGIDADRLEEEKRRGITIDIGFAHLELSGPDGEILRLGFVDVPGHERFVRNMLAGVGGIDLVLLVIAADESIKPQTREHFDICRLLSVRRGITVLTKSDLVGGETLDVVRLEVEEFLRGSFLDPVHSPIVAVSSLTGVGLDQLKQALAKVAAEVPAKDSTALARLPIDGPGGCRPAHRVEPGGCGHGRTRSGNDAGAVFDFPLHVSLGRKALAAAFSQAVERPRPRAFACLHLGNYRRGHALWHEAGCSGWGGIRAIALGGAGAAAAPRPFHSAAVFAGGDDWGWRGSGCGAAGLQAAGD